MLSDCEVAESAARATVSLQLGLGKLGWKALRSMLACPCNTTPKTGPTAKTDGIYGIRINHMLEVHVDGFGLTNQ